MLSRKVLPFLAAGLAAAIFLQTPAMARTSRGSFGRGFVTGVLGAATGSAIGHALTGSGEAVRAAPVGDAGRSERLPADCKGNRLIASFSASKKLLLSRIYTDDNETIYCRGHFGRGRQIFLPAGFETPGEENRARRLEWEHAVPAENFGRAFAEWREGVPQCVDGRGKPFKGLKCAETNEAFNLMESDMYNLYPAIGAVNALRSNYRYAQQERSAPNTFGSCPMKIVGRTAEPPDWAKGRAARSTLYMAWAYPAYFRLSDSQEKLMKAWDRKFPVDRKECIRAARIESVQGNENPLVKDGCVRSGLWQKQ